MYVNIKNIIQIIICVNNIKLILTNWLLIFSVKFLIVF